MKVGDYHGLFVAKQKKVSRYPVAGLTSCSLDAE